MLRTRVCAAGLGDSQNSVSEQKSMKRRLARRARREFAATFFAWLMLSPVLVLGVDKPDFKPGYNFYSPQDDAQVGKESSAQVDRQLPFLNDAEAHRVPQRLGEKAGGLCPQQPSGIYVASSGSSTARRSMRLLCRAGTFMSIAGCLTPPKMRRNSPECIAHESGHVVMRHGTHIASQAVLAQGGMAMLYQHFWARAAA